MFIYIYLCITQSSVYNKADSRQHGHENQKCELVMLNDSIESRAYIYLIQVLEKKKVRKSWDEKGIFDLVKIDAGLGFRNASSQH